MASTSGRHEKIHGSYPAIQTLSASRAVQPPRLAILIRKLAIETSRRDRLAMVALTLGILVVSISVVVYRYQSAWRSVWTGVPEPGKSGARRGWKMTLRGLGRVMFLHSWLMREGAGMIGLPLAMIKPRLIRRRSLHRVRTCLHHHHHH